MNSKLFSGYTMVITRLELSPEMEIPPTPLNLCSVECIRHLDPDSYWVRIRAVELEPFSRRYTAIFRQEQLAQSLPLSKSWYLASKEIIAPHQPALTDRNHAFLGGFLVQVGRLLEEDLFLGYARSVAFSFVGLPRKTVLPREQLSCVLPLPSWRKRYTTPRRKGKEGL